MSTAVGMGLNIKDVLQRDPSAPLVNQGQARIADKANEKVLQELKGELSMFVCEGQYADGMQRIIESYLANLTQTSQKAAWVSGFFGSGKSHFLKMLAHLWQDTRFDDDGTTARTLVKAMPDELRSLLRELDTAGKRAGGLLAAPGALPSGTTDNVRLTIGGVLLRAVGLPEQYAQAQFCLWLHDQKYFDTVKRAVEKDGKTWVSELNNLYVSGTIARAVMGCDSRFASSEVEARKTLREQFPQRVTDVSTSEFLSVFKRAIALAGRDGRMPCTVLVLDEVQQYIGQSQERSTLVSEVAEAVSKQLDSYVVMVGAGQSALTDVPLLQRLMDRFTIRVSLSDTDVETVTRKVLLDKKPSAKTAVRSLLDTHAGEVSRELQGTKIGESSDDRDIIVRDYPLLPVRRRFWEHCFRQVDAAGTQSQLRSQLRIIHDAVSKLKDRSLGALIPGDELFEALAPEMVNTGVLLREINERIINLSKDGTPDGALARRICGLAFLIGKLPREAGADIGVRATKEHIADLLVDDLTADNGKLRSAVELSLKKLENNGVLMRVGEEYRLQTKEGSEWDREFRLKQSKLQSNDADLQIRRDALLYADADTIVRSLKIAHGLAKESRPLVIYRDQTPPQPNGDGIPVWIRDGWSASRKEVEDAARTAGTDSPVISVFIPRQSPEDLRRLIIEAEAALQTLDFKGVPTTQEGIEAQQSMKSRHDLASQQCASLVKEIVSNAQVFQGGGTEMFQLTLPEKLRDAANASLVRLFPRFKEADASPAAWEAAMKRAREGSDQPFQPINNYTGATEQHPVGQQLLATIGSGKTGAEVRKTLKASPFGWPQDAIDAALIALHRSQYITATLNGNAVALAQLDQNKISKSEFRVERTTLSATDRIAIRGAYMELGIQCKSGEEALKAAEFLAALTVLAASAGGQPPMPAPPATTDIEDMKRLVGNDQLVAIKNSAAELKKRTAVWKKLKELADKRKPIWDVVERFARQAIGISAASDQLAQVEAIKNGRMLLDTADPSAPVRAALADVLRKAINDAHTAHEQAYVDGMAMLDGNSTWQRVPVGERARILGEVGLAGPDKLDIGSDDLLIASLDRRSVAARQAEVAAVPGRLQQALELAAKYLEPKVRTLKVSSTTLRNEHDVRDWLSRHEQLLLDAVKKGPVFVS